MITVMINRMKTSMASLCTFLLLLLLNRRMIRVT